MFYFSVCSKYLLDIELNELAQDGVVIDNEFQAKFIKEFSSKTYPNESESNNSIYILEEIDVAGFFRVENFSPSTVYDALCFINKYFFHPPDCVWLNGKSYDIGGQYGEITYSTEKVISPR